MSKKNGNQNVFARRSRRSLIRLHPREDSFEISQGRSVLSTSLNGSITADTTHGFFVHQTRMLSHYRWLIDNIEPMAVALSNVEQHSWLGYYIQSPGTLQRAQQDRGSGEMAAASEKSLELRLSRSVGYGLHEDVDITNFRQEPVEIELELELELDADFVDQQEAVRKRQQFGKLTRSWRQNEGGNWELLFDYVSQHHYKHQEDEGDACIHRSIAIEIANCDSAPSYSEGVISFRLSLQPFATWHACVRMRPQVEDEPDLPLYDCYAFQPTGNRFDASRSRFLDGATSFSTPGTETLATVAVHALEQAKCDLGS